VEGVSDDDLLTEATVMQPATPVQTGSQTQRVLLGQSQSQ
jgi:hypothetical protein